MLDDQQGNVQATDNEGRFSFPGATAPYRLSIATHRDVFIFDGLRTAKPIIVPYATGFVNRFASLSARVSGAAARSPDGSDFIELGWGKRLNKRYTCSLDGDCETQLYWYGVDSTRSEQLTALQFRIYRRQVEFLRMGKGPVLTAENDGEVEGIEFELDTEVPLATAQMQVHTKAYTLNEARLLSVNVADTEVFLNIDISSQLGEFITIPAGGARFRIVGSSNGYRVIRNVDALPNDSFLIFFPDKVAPIATSPGIEHGDQPPNPTLSWSSPPGAKAHMINILGPKFIRAIVPGKRTSWSVPDLTALGVPGLDRGETFEWDITSFTEGMTVDDFADGLGMAELQTKPGLTYFESTHLPFKTAP
jgi:hypothetical protein